MDSDDEIFLTQDTFSQEPFSPELNLEELVRDFREVSERDSVEVEKKENPGRNIVVVCDNEIEERRESRIPANTKVNTPWAVRCWEASFFSSTSGLRFPSSSNFSGAIMRSSLIGMGRRTQCKS